MKIYNKTNLSAKGQDTQPKMSIASNGSISFNMATIELLFGKPSGAGIGGVEFAQGDNTKDWYIRRNDADGLPVRQKGDSPVFLIQSTALKNEFLSAIGIEVDKGTLRFMVVPKPQIIEGAEWYLIITKPL